MKTYTYDETLSQSIAYFGGDLLAASTAAKKYLLRNNEERFLESTPDGMHVRLATEFARIEKSMDPLCNEAEYFKRVYELLKNFSRTVPQGSPMAGIGNPYLLQSLSNCTVVDSPKDSIAGIFATGCEIAQLQKRRAGVGVDLATLRPYGSRVNNAAGVSSGVPCFADFFSHITRMIGQGGRIGALMLTTTVEHPDSDRYATMKQDLTKVTGANVSFRITDAFMRAVINDEPFTQQWPVGVPLSEAKVTKVIRAKDLWDLIVEMAWKNAEPGLLFWDNYTNNLPAHRYPGFFTISTNPCSELGLSAYDSCRLISKNLRGYVRAAFTKDAEFDYKSFYEDTKLAQRMSDGLVELELEIIDKILKKAGDESETALWTKFRWAAFNGRRTGLGTHALGDVFLGLGVRYDSDEARTEATKIYKNLRDASYWSSVEMAKERGPFPVWDWKVDKECDFIKRLDPDLQDGIKTHGRRNISNLTNAPTGSVAIQSRTSSGIESVFSWLMDRFVKIPHNNTDYPVDRVDGMGDKWTRFRVIHPAVKAYFVANGIECPVGEGRDFSASLDDGNALLASKLPPHFVTSSQIDPLKGVQLQGAIQTFIDHGISRTINMPRGSTKDQIDAIYRESWKLGLKGVTVYVDGCRDGVLIATDKKNESTRPTSIQESHAPKRPASIEAEVHRVKVKGKDWGVIVGLLDAKPFEVWGGANLVIPKLGDIEHAKITKVGSKRYNLSVKIKDNGIDEIGDLCEIYDNPEQRVITRSLCRELRHGVPIEYIWRDLQDYEGPMVDYVSALARVLKKYVIKSERLKATCSQCGSKNMKMLDCLTCVDCGSSKCG